MTFNPDPKNHSFSADLLKVSYFAPFYNNILVTKAGSQKRLGLVPESELSSYMNTENVSEFEKRWT